MRISELLESTIGQSIQQADTPIYAYVIGGSASGKNYWYERNLQEIPLVDIDVYTKQLALDTGGDPRKLVSKGIAMCNKELGNCFEKGESVGQTGTGANTKGVYNRLKKAKDAGFNTALILISVDPEVAIERNQQRVDSGGHGDTLSADKITRTNGYARKTYEELKDDTEVVTFAYKVDA